MFDNLRRRREEKQAKAQAIAESQYWKNHPKLQACLQSMRGSCTVAPAGMHEAALAAVNIALAEGCWSSANGFPDDLHAETVFIVWDNERIPVLKAPLALVRQNLVAVTAVSARTFLVAETMDQILWFGADGGIRLYSIA